MPVTHKQALLALLRDMAKIHPSHGHRFNTNAATMGVVPSPRELMPHAIRIGRIKAH
jgi:hypothetical protein